MERRWYILWAINDCSPTKVEMCLKGMDAKLWVPVFSQVVGQEKESVPLYPGYYFVECTLDILSQIEDRIYGLRSKNNLVFLKDDTKKPYALTDEEVNRVKSVEEKEIDDATLMPKDKVRVIAGPLKECTAIVLGVKKGFVQIQTTMFNREMDAMWVPSCDVEKLKD